ncbi:MULTISPECIES: nitrogen regulation protein NR(II) [Rheinheimera]|uniref:Sensory histidine kinase/phosphatase NtrB n=1 Tax=Rheinheimera marina TaxID=1774958 RepID=A0ABV9JMK7_9GAMM
MEWTAASLTDQLSTAVLVLDTQLQVQYFNTACCALFGIGEKKLNQQYFPTLFQHTDLSTSFFLTAIQNRQGFGISDVQAVLLDGRHMLLDVTVNLMEEPTLLLLEIRQVDQQRKISQESLQQHQHLAARELIRGLAHEIKNPLGGLRGAAQLLEESLNDEQKEYTQLIIAQADRLRNLVDRLLGPYKAPQKKMQNVHQVIEQVVQLAQMDNPHQVLFIRDYDPSIPDFQFDPELIEQALLNIVGNAQQVLEQAGGQITLQTRVLNQHTLHGRRHRLVAAVKVTDNGPGIPPEIKDTLFFPMVSGKAGGTGLGLSIAQTLIHQHGGWIDCESWPGQTSFTLYLPLNNSGD